MNRADTAEELAPPAPPCFGSRMQWIGWIRAAADAQKGGVAEDAGPLLFRVPGEPVFNRSIDYCQDCSTPYRAAMQRADRCKPKHLLET